jgi:hypothetical protein
MLLLACCAVFVIAVSLAFATGTTTLDRLPMHAAAAFLLVAASVGGHMLDRDRGQRPHR